MNLLWLLTLLSWLFLTVALPHHVSASGYILDLGPDNFCYKKAPQKVTFAPPPFTYVFTGTCNMIHTRAQLPVDVPWTVVGTYDPATGRTTEDINVPPPAISQPSRPYGRFLATMHCAADPWRDPRVLCDQISASANPPATAYPPNAWGNYSRELVTQIINSINSYRRPYSGEMEDPHRQFLNAQFQAFEAAQRKEQQLLHGSKKSGDLAFSANPPPLIASPKPGQTFPAQTTVPIKLVPPGGWTVTGYVVTIQRKDPNGNWVAHATIPVSAAVAQTGSGYTGFGGGAPPAFLMLPGRWRLNAQALSPRKSGITEWVEFTATVNTLRSKKLTPYFTP